MKKKILFALVIVVLTFNIFGQIIPDDNFRIKINENLGQPDDYEPTIADLNGITGTLDARYANIFSIEGAQYLINLSDLYLSGNNISDISQLSDLLNLTSLRLIDNQISDISELSGLTNLAVLALYYNQISDVTSLSGLTNLIALYLGSNQISDVTSLSGLVNLIVLQLFDNQISDISPLSGLTNLSSLDLNSNLISYIPVLTGLPNLTRLNLFDNQISDIFGLSALVNLDYLNLSHNQISDISSLSGLINLSGLTLTSNQISIISALSDLINLLGLELGNNHISDISELSNLINLEYLFLHNNQISDISGLSALTNLVFLDLSDNQIIEISSIAGMPNLFWLDLRNNQINDISALANMANLYFLFLSGNQITDIFPIVESAELSMGYYVFLHNDEFTNPLSIEAIEDHIPYLQNQGFDLFYPTTPNFNAACYPSPDRYQENVSINSDLSWIGMDIGVTYEIFLGTSMEHLSSIGIGQYIGENTFTISPELQSNTEYYWRVKSITENEELWSGMWCFTTINGVESIDYTVENFLKTNLNTAYPNPFNPSTKISFYVQENETAKLDIVNIKGELVKSYINFSSGHHSIEWNGKDTKGNILSSGIYFYKLQTGSTSEVRKMLLLK